MILCQPHGGKKQAEQLLPAVMVIVGKQCWTVVHVPPRERTEFGCPEAWRKGWLNGPMASSELHVPKDILTSLLITMVIPKGDTERLDV